MKISFPVMTPMIVKIDYETMTVYHQDIEQGQHVYNFIKMFHKHSPWELLINHPSTPSEKRIVDGWMREYLLPPPPETPLKQIKIDYGKSPLPPNQNLPAYDTHRRVGGCN
jgi:hypothetical protein